MNNCPCLAPLNFFLSFEAASDEVILRGRYFFITFIIFQANVVCKQLKYSGATSVACCSPRGPVPTNFSYDNVQCAGTEATLDACPHANLHDCFPSEGVWIVCNTGIGQ